jgi:hypothetical protein
MGVFELGQDVPGLGQGGGDNVFRHLQQIEDPGVGHLVEDRGALLPALDDVCPAQGAEMLGKVGGLEADTGNQLGDTVLAVTKQLQDLDSSGMSQGPEKLGPDLVNGTGNLSTLQQPPRTGVIKADYIVVPVTKSTKNYYLMT